MNETIDLMLNHSSVRRFTEEPLVAEDLEAIIAAGRAASSWKNFQSYSIVVVQTEAKKQALYDLVPQPAILQAQAILVFVGTTIVPARRRSFMVQTLIPKDQRIS